MNTKFQAGEMVKATQGAGKFFESGDIGRVIRHADDKTVKVDWSAGNNPKGFYGDGEWWANECDLVRLNEEPPAKLTLPIVVGKKYVRGDNSVREMRELACGDRWMLDTENHSYRTADGHYLYDEPHRLDLVADYIEPAKGHPHAAAMAEFAKDAAECETPWDRWEFQACEDHPWAPCNQQISWYTHFCYRRKSEIAADPHAESAAEYAKDMAQTDKAWERWENFNGFTWDDLDAHPRWLRGLKYRRKGSL